MPDEGQGQKCRLWIPDGVKTIKGIIVDLGFPHGADRADYQAFARANDWAVLGTLLRWPPTLKANLDRIIADYAKQTAHPELVNVPWVMEGFSRSVGAGGALALHYPDKVLSVMAGGISYGLKTEEVPAANRVPTMNVVGSADAFAAGPEAVKDLGWFMRNQPAYREKHVPWGAAIQWGAGHFAGTGFVMHAAFLGEVMAIRMPKNWDPNSGPPKLTDMEREEAGWLGDVASWDTAYPTVAPFKDFKGDRLKAHWLPGPYSAAVWRAYVVKEPDVSIIPPDGDKNEFAITAAGNPSKVEFYDGDNLLAAGSPLSAVNLLGLRCLYAVATIDGKPHISRPILTYNGHAVPLGGDSAVASMEPLALLELTPTQKATAKILLDRLNYPGPAQWKLAFEDDFSKGIGAWSVGSLPGESKIVDGALEIESRGQMLCALPYDWPRDVAVECRCRVLAASDAKRHDMAVMIGGLHGGSRPWRDGLMFHFSPSEGLKTAWQVVGETDPELGVKAKAGQWHQLRIERLDNTLGAWIDGRELPRRKLFPGERRGVKGQRLGFYVVAAKAQFGDVKVYLRTPDDPAAIRPTMPAEKDQTELAIALFTLRCNPNAEQRNLSSNLLRTLSTSLANTLRTLDPALLPADARPLYAQIVKSLLPTR
jgi:hypothetical protein